MKMQKTTLDVETWMEPDRTTRTRLMNPGEAEAFEAALREGRMALRMKWPVRPEEHQGPMLRLNHGWLYLPTDNWSVGRNYVGANNIYYVTDDEPEWAIPRGGAADIDLYDLGMKHPAEVLDWRISTNCQLNEFMRSITSLHYQAMETAYLDGADNMMASWEAFFQRASKELESHGEMQLGVRVEYHPDNPRIAVRTARRLECRILAPSSSENRRKDRSNRTRRQRSKHHKMHIYPEMHIPMDMIEMLFLGNMGEMFDTLEWKISNKTQLDAFDLEMEDLADEELEIIHRDQLEIIHRDQTGRRTESRDDFFRDAGKTLEKQGEVRIEISGEWDDEGDMTTAEYRIATL